MQLAQKNLPLFRTATIIYRSAFVQTFSDKVLHRTKLDGAVSFQQQKIFMAPENLPWTENQFLLDHSDFFYPLEKDSRLRWLALTEGGPKGKVCTRQKANNTRSSQVVSHPSTILAQCCLTSLLGRELVYSTWYGRWLFKSHKFNPFWSN